MMTRPLPEAFGLASAELFQYNSLLHALERVSSGQGENFQFDNEQRISRDAARSARRASVWCFYDINH